MKKVFLALTMLTSFLAFATEVLEPLLITKVTKYRNLMPGPGRNSPNITLIEATYERCGGLGHENLKVTVKKVSENIFQVAILAPGIDCAGLPSKKQLHLSLTEIPHEAGVSFKNPVLVEYLGDVH